MSKKKRFVVSENEGTLSSATIIVDQQTGINYLFYHSGYAGGLTPLLDRDGKPIITTISADK